MIRELSSGRARTGNLVVVVWSVLGWIGAALVVVGGCFNIARRPTVKADPYLGLRFPSRATAALGRAAPFTRRIGAVLLAAAIVGQLLTR